MLQWVDIDERLGIRIPRTAVFLVRHRHQDFASSRTGRCHRQQTFWLTDVGNDQPRENEQNRDVNAKRNGKRSRLLAISTAAMFEAHKKHPDTTK